jgi:hypothetical protein
MKKFKEIFNYINWKEFGLSMGIFLMFFIFITIGMLITNTWSFGGKEMNLFLGFGFILSFIINMIKQFK